jgi:predicted phage terminase large subunit-like protein
MGPYWWQAQYQGVPGQYGRNEWPETYFANIWAQEDEWPVNAPFSSVALDPSKGAHEDSGDYQAMVYAAFANGKLWLDFDVDRRPVPQMMRDFARFCYDRRPGIVGIESNAFQYLLAPDYLAACQAIHYNVTEPELMENTVNKLVRIMRLATYFDARSIRVRRNAGGEEFIRQAKAFPNGDYDDALDGAEMAIRLLNYFVTGAWNDDEAEILVA